MNQRDSKLQQRTDALAYPNGVCLLTSCYLSSVVAQSASGSSEADEDEEFVRDWVAEIFDRVLVSLGEVASQVSFCPITPSAPIPRE